MGYPFFSAHFWHVPQEGEEDGDAAEADYLVGHSVRDVIIAGPTLLGLALWIDGTPVRAIAAAEDVDVASIGRTKDIYLFVFYFVVVVSGLPNF